MTKTQPRARIMIQIARATYGAIFFLKLLNTSKSLTSLYPYHYGVTNAYISTIFT